MTSGDLNKVWEIRALKKPPRQDEAKKILEKIAKQVQPIMRKHKWRVKVLSEFCPKNPSLLGVNVARGVNVKLRLRMVNRDCDFLPFDEVLDTMLHELCHNVHSSHNGSFYKLWDELRKECEELMSKGITGTSDGFDLPGRRLGGVSCQPPLSSLHKTALAAAEKRAHLGSLLPSGPKRLGGDRSIMAALSPIQAAAMAAERRFQDDIWCGSQSCEAAEDEESSSDILQDLVFMGQSAEGSGLDGGSSARAVDPVSRKRRRESDQNSFGQSSKDHASTSWSMLDRDNRSLNSEEPAMWKCGKCTLLNPLLAPICELCESQRPKDAVTKDKTWSCKFCTVVNNVKLEKCSVCRQWRHSHGPLVNPTI
ncbi:dna-dependent metalloprotease wss1 [Fagus crenata]